MRLGSTRVLTTAIFSFLLASIAACGGTKQDAKAPAITSADVPRGGSTGTGDPSPTDLDAPSPPANEAAAASTKEDGSDIIPPFPSAGKASKQSKPAKKAAGRRGKHKKKG